MATKLNVFKNTLKKVYIRTFGCQINVNDSEYIVGQLVKLGYSITEDIFNSNLILLTVK